ncbi:Ctf8p and Ctf18p associating protein [Candidozyma auris]|uniref:Sister chromatid cohesion protein DCC1 n=1 Tax=Candidozyma auris TaxID=498019 RepID=A0A2H1A7D2_CANAR|nr:hypothetical protein B9J08_000232 [[Candida] auris]
MSFTFSCNLYYSVLYQTRINIHTTDMSFNVYCQTSKRKDYTYKLVELSDDLVDYIKKGKGSLSFKSPKSIDNHLVLCTDDETYTVRQQNHSNTTILMNDAHVNKLKQKFETTDSSLVGIEQLSYTYELTKSSGYIDTAGIAKYPGGDVKSSKNIDQVKADSPVDAAHFEKQWYGLCGSTIDGYAVLLETDFITDALYTLISILLSLSKANEEYDLQQVASKCESQNTKLTKEIVATLSHRFGEETSPSRFKLDQNKCAWWFGVETMKKASPSLLTEKEFMLKWKSSLPPFFSASLDLSFLRGNFCRPQSDKIRYLNPEMLSKDLHARIKELFQMVKEWDYEEFLSFIDSFIPATKKKDSVIVKFARKKRVGKNKFVVCPR